MSTTILGYKISAPIIIGPTANHQLAHPEGELIYIFSHGICFSSKFNDLFSCFRRGCHSESSRGMRHHHGLSITYFKPFFFFWLLLLRAHNFLNYYFRFYHMGLVALWRRLLPAAMLFGSINFM